MVVRLEDGVCAAMAAAAAAALLLVMILADDDAMLGSCEIPWSIPPPSGDVAGDEPWPGGEGAVPFVRLFDLRFFNTNSVTAPPPCVMYESYCLIV